MKIFIAGVMQGNRKDKKIYAQHYRTIITNKLSQVIDHVDVVDPDKTDPDRLTYTHGQAKQMFFKYCNIASKVDLLIAYIPEASMGSAIEMWMAHANNVPIITISPMKSNWVIKLMSSIIYSDIEEFLLKFNRKSLNKLLTL